MSKVSLKTQPVNTQAVEYLLEYQKILEDRVLALRAEACIIAAKVREIRKSITAEQVQAVADQKQADKDWSLSDGNGHNIMDLVSNGK